jgi:ADP-glucose pyrophosphorylase
LSTRATYPTNLWLRYAATESHRVGDYRLVDFVLSNLVNGGYLKILVLTQYKSHSLDRHIATTTSPSRR